MKHFHHNQYDDLDVIMSECGGFPRGKELPQVLSEEDAVIDALCEITGQPRVLTDAVYHHQITSDTLH